MEAALSELILLLQNTEEHVGTLPQSGSNHEPLAAFLKAFREKRLEPLYWRLQRMNTQRYVLSMVGLTNVGKSTLAHALLGHAVAPRRNGPATAIPVEYELAEKPWKLQTMDEDNLTVNIQEFDSSEELSKALERKVFTQTSPDCPSPSSTRLIVKGPMPLLADDLVFADTPGFGAAQLGTQSDHHEEVLINYLKHHVHETMFCISSKNAMVSNDEQKFFQSIEHLCSTVVVTKWDGGSPKDKQEKQKYAGRFAELFPMCRFLFVNAKDAIQNLAQPQNDANSELNTRELDSIFAARRTKHERQQLLSRDVERACSDLMALIQKPLLESNLASVPWHIASLANFKYEADSANIKNPFLI